MCLDWNLKKNGCAGKGPCSAGRTHACAVCGNLTHRGIDAHKIDDIYQALGMQQGKGKGKGKKNGKGKGKKKQKELLDGGDGH